MQGIFPGGSRRGPRHRAWPPWRAPRCLRSHLPRRFSPRAASSDLFLHLTMLCAQTGTSCGLCRSGVGGQQALSSWRYAFFACVILATCSHPFDPIAGIASGASPCRPVFAFRASAYCHRHLVIAEVSGSPSPMKRFGAARHILASFTARSMGAYPLAIRSASILRGRDILTIGWREPGHLPWFIYGLCAPSTARPCRHADNPEAARSVGVDARV